MWGIFLGCPLCFKKNIACILALSILDSDVFFWVSFILEKKRLRVYWLFRYLIVVCFFWGVFCTLRNIVCLIGSSNVYSSTEIDLFLSNGTKFDFMDNFLLYWYCP